MSTRRPWARAASLSGDGASPRRGTHLGVIGGLAVLGVVVGSGVGLIRSDSGAGRSVPDAVTEGVEAQVATTPLWRCPGEGRLGALAAGDRVVVTARSTEGAWLQVRLPVDLAARAWVTASAVESDAATDALPVIECPVPESSPPSGSSPASATTTTPQLEATTTVSSAASTTSVPGRPTTTGSGAPSTTAASRPATTTVAADVTGPTLTSLGVTPATIWTVEQPGVPCVPAKASTATVSVGASDAGGVASARAEWSVNGRSGVAPMTRSGSTWQGTLGPFAADTLPTSGAGMNQSIAVVVRVTDGSGNSSTSTATVALRSSAECFG